MPLYQYKSRTKIQDFLIASPPKRTKEKDQIEKFSKCDRLIKCNKTKLRPNIRVIPINTNELNSPIKPKRFSK